MQYLVVSLGDAKEATPTINKTLNPEWNTTLEMPVVGEQNLLLEATCWDKDRFGKDYMGEFDVILEDVFAHGQPIAEPQWFPLESRRNGRKKSHVSGEIQIQFTLIDTSNPTATPEQIIAKFLAIAGQTPSPDESDESGLLRADSAGTDLDDDDDESESSNEAQDESKKAAKREKRRRKLRMARLKKKAKQVTGYEYSDKSEVAGVLFLEVVNITDLPPEKNVTRTSFDMDPFVVTSLGKKTYRTKTIRHDLNPVYEEKLVFQVLRHETNYSVNFTVVDKDKFSGNDYVGMVNFPLEKVVSVAPVADPETGLYRLPEPSDSPGLPDANRRSRFRLPVSRSSSSHSLSRMGLPTLKKETSTGSLSAKDSNGLLPPAPTSAPAVDSNGNLAPVPAINVDPSVVDDQALKTFTLPLEMKNKERWEAKHSPVLYIRAKYLPYKALRQQFWRAMLKQYDADESGLIDKIELTTMLDTLGSTLHASTIDSFFSRFMAAHNGDELLTFDEAVICLEDQLQKIEQKEAKGNSGLFTPGTQTPSLASGEQTPMNKDPSRTSVPVLDTNELGAEGEQGDLLEDDLADETGEEHVIEIRECPICHQPKLNKRSDANIITHIATCASQDWKQVNNIVMSGFVTSSQAQRKWYSKVITKISYGGYKLGANSANILVQDRLTGQINEERMSVYVRLGIRMLYKGLKANNMEKKRIRKLLKSLSFKQGRKYDDPASAKEIEGFIAFHQLNMSEVLKPTSEFKNFNEFFYRALKPGARPCSAPEDSRVIVSPADCRSVVFNTIDQAQSIWVKGREFTVERLLGDAYPQDAARYHGGSLGIFRLAPQDYHRFHIPVDGVMDEPKTIEGEYYTVNPMAIRSSLDVYGENVRVICPIDSVSHGRVMVICIGAMMVGSTVITRHKGEQVKRAEELGYFKFGGSTLLLLFEPGQMRYDDDLADNSKSALETLVSAPIAISLSLNLTISRFVSACPSATVLTGHRMYPTCARATQHMRRSKMPSVASRAAWLPRALRGPCPELACRRAVLLQLHVQQMRATCLGRIHLGTVA